MKRQRSPQGKLHKKQDGVTIPSRSRWPKVLKSIALECKYEQTEANEKNNIVKVTFLTNKDPYKEVVKDHNEKRTIKHARKGMF